MQYFLDEKIIIEEFDLSKNSCEKFVKVYRISDDLNDISDLKLTEKQKCVLEFLKKSEEATVKEITYFVSEDLTDLNKHFKSVYENQMCRL